MNYFFGLKTDLTPGRISRPDNSGNSLSFTVAYRLVYVNGHVISFSSRLFLTGWLQWLQLLLCLRVKKLIPFRKSLTFLQSKIKNEPEILKKPQSIKKLYLYIYRTVKR